MKLFRHVPLLLTLAIIAASTPLWRSDDRRLDRGLGTIVSRSKSSSENHEGHTTVQRRSSDDDEPDQGQKGQRNADGSRQKSRWNERMGRIKAGTANEKDLLTVQNIRMYNTGYASELRQGERRRLETGEMTFEEFEKIVARRKKASQRRRERDRIRKERIVSGRASAEELEKDEARRAAARKASAKQRAARKARKEAGEESEADKAREERIRTRNRISSKEYMRKKRQDKEFMATRREKEKKRYAEKKARKEVGQQTAQEKKQEESNRARNREASREYMRTKRLEAKQAKPTKMKAGETAGAADDDQITTSPTTTTKQEKKNARDPVIQDDDEPSIVDPEQYSPELPDDRSKPRSFSREIVPLGRTVAAFTARAREAVGAGGASWKEATKSMRRIFFDGGGLLSVPRSSLASARRLVSGGGGGGGGGRRIPLMFSR